METGELMKYIGIVYEYSSCYTPFLRRYIKGGGKEVEVEE